MKQPSKVLNLTKREKIQNANTTILIIVVVASIIVSFALVFGNFLWKQKSYNDRVYKEKRLARDTLKQNVANAKVLQQKFEEIEDSKSLANSQTILDALPGNYNNPEVRSSIEALVRRNSISLESMNSADREGSVEEESIDPKPLEIPVTATVVGSYGNIRNFITDLERTIRPMKVQSMTITGSDNDMKVDMTIVTYFQPTQEIGTTTKEVR